MRAAAALHFVDSGKVHRVLLIVGVVEKSAGFGLLLGLTKVYALLLGVMGFLGLATVTADMRGPLLALLSAVLALRDGSALLRDEDKLAV